MSEVHVPDAPLVSIGMPVYNGMPFLPKTLDCILGQTFQDLELVISDNASTDDTQAVCTEYAARDSRIRYSRNTENIGASENYNRVFALSRGRYFKWAAADDVLAPSMLEQCVASLESDTKAVLAFPNTINIDGRGREAGRIDDPLRVASSDAVDRVLEVWAQMRECNAIFGLIRRDVLSRTALIGCYIAADANLLAELAMHGRFRHIGAYLFLRREHAASSSADKSTGAQMRFYDPRLGDRFVMSGWRLFGSAWRALKNAPLSTRDRRQLAAKLLRRMYWSRKPLASEIISSIRQSLIQSRK